jgi:uncharacterized protein with HEPN domain
MSPDQSRDLAYLLDMLAAARRAHEYVAGVAREAFGRDSVLQDAVVRRLEIVGEAARRVSEATRQRHQEIAWRRIVGLRHRLAHDYLHVDIERVWEIVQRDVPDLITKLERLVPPDEPSGASSPP